MLSSLLLFIFSAEKGFVSCNNVCDSIDSVGYVKLDQTVYATKNVRCNNETKTFSVKNFVYPFTANYTLLEKKELNGFFSREYCRINGLFVKEGNSVLNDIVFLEKGGVLITESFRIECDNRFITVLLKNKDEKIISGSKSKWCPIDNTLISKSMSRKIRYNGQLFIRNFDVLTILCSEKSRQALIVNDKVVSSDKISFAVICLEGVLRDLKGNVLESVQCVNKCDLKTFGSKVIWDPLDFYSYQGRLYRNEPFIIRCPFNHTFAIKSTPMLLVDALKIQCVNNKLKVIESNVPHLIKFDCAPFKNPPVSFANVIK